MPSKSLIQSYINNFRRRITPHLRPNIGLSCTVHPTKQDGAVLEFAVGHGIENDDRYDPESSTIGQALGTIRQGAFGGNLDGFVFTGTNVVMESGRIIFIKDNALHEWTDAAAKKDVDQIVLTRTGTGGA